jgi:hypothetical protein
MGDHHREAVAWHWESRFAFLKDGGPIILHISDLATRPHEVNARRAHDRDRRGPVSLHSVSRAFVFTSAGNEQRSGKIFPTSRRCCISCHVVDHAPVLSKVARNEETNRKKEWTATFIYTSGGYVVKGGTNESAQAGSRVNQTRPTFIVPDDIDGREDSSVITKKRLKRLTGEILPMRQGNTLVYFAQNLISRFSVMYQIHKQEGSRSHQSQADTRSAGGHQSRFRQANSRRHR